MPSTIIRRHPLPPVLVPLAAAGVAPNPGPPAHVEPPVAALARAQHPVVRTERPDGPPATTRARARGARSFRAA
ncbi:hypothetical protein [Umezawaea sp.]|uniref:hypothetical protein n=1 Tax=Umezawaea sp. TaxID=1955258 RepID=UPI002ED59F5F